MQGRIVGRLTLLLVGVLLLSCADKRQLALVRGTEGDRHAEAGLYEQAIAAYREAIELYPRDPEPRLRLGRIYASLGEYEQSIAALADALALDAGLVEAQVLMGRVYLAQERHEEAAAAFGAAKVVAPGDLDAVMGLAMVELARHDFVAGAVGVDAEAAALEARLDLRMLASRDLPEAVVERVEQVLALGGATGPARWPGLVLAHGHLRRGNELARSGKLTAALAEYGKSVDLDPRVVRTSEARRHSFAYDESGNLTQRVDANGDTTRYVYDALGHILGIRYNGRPGVEFSYRPDGALRRMTDPTGTTSFGYDRQGRVTGIDYSDGSRVVFAHGQGLSTRTVRHMDDSETVYEHDGSGRLAEVSDASGSTRLEYGTGGDLVKVKRTNGLTSTYSYDGAGRPTGSEHRLNGELLLAYGFELDGAGRPRRKTRVAGVDTLVWEFSYNLSGRLTEVRRSDGMRTTYEYDRSGNRVRHITAGDTTEYVYGQYHQLRMAGDTWYEYDGNGNLTQRISPEGVVDYQYDVENRLVAVDGPDSRARFEYRGDGVRWSCETQGETTRLLADAEGTLLARVSGGGVTPVSVLGKVGEVDGRSPATEGARSFLYDRPGGDVVAAVDSMGQITSLMDFDPFGQTIDDGGGQPDTFGYRGAEMEPEAGLIYLDGRYFDPTLGRFLTPRQTGGPSLQRFENPYAGLDFSLGRSRDDGSVEESLVWVDEDPLATAVKGILRGQYRPPVKVGVPTPAAPAKQDILRDRRLVSLVPATAITLCEGDLLRPDAGHLAIALPQSQTASSGFLSTEAARLAVAHIQHRWQWAPGQQRGPGGITGGTESTGGLTEMEGAELIGPGLEGFEELYRDLGSPESPGIDAYRSFLSGVKEQEASADDGQALLNGYPQAMWVPQVHVLYALQLVREQRAAEAEAHLGSVTGPEGEWGEALLMMRLVVAQVQAQPEIALALRERLQREFADSRWDDDALYLVGRAHQQAGQGAEALRIYGQLPDGFPESVWTSGALLRPPPARYLERITRVTSAVYDPVSRQLILAGENDPDLSPVDMDDLVVVLRAIYTTRQDPAVSIGTEASGVTGYKKVRYDGGTEGTPFGMTMYEADYVLKLLSVGVDSTQAPVDPDMEGYRSVIDYSMEMDGLALGVTWNTQVWFVPGAVPMQKTPDGHGVLIDDITMIVVSESKFSRRRIVQRGAEAFSQYMTEQYPLLAEKFPAIGKLPELAKLVAIGKWMRDQRLPIDAEWLAEYEVTAVATPKLVKAGEAVREKPGETVWDALKVVVEGGVSFREPNTYGVTDAAQSQQVGEVLAFRPNDATATSWTIRPASGAAGESRAVALPMGRARRAGSLVLGLADFPVLGGFGAGLTRYYDSFDLRPGPFGRGWKATPYELRFQRELTGAPGDRGQVEPGSVALFVDRPSGRTESMTIISSLARGSGLHMSLDGDFSLTTASGAELLFDAEGRLSAYTDRRGRRVEYRYVGSRLMSIADSYGFEIGLTYDADGRVMAASDNRGTSTRYEYDERALLTRTWDLAGRPTQYQYSAAGRLVGLDRGDDEAFQVAYDPTGRVQAFQDAQGEVVAFDYDAAASQAGAEGGGAGERMRMPGKVGAPPASVGGGLSLGRAATGELTGLVDGAGNQVEFSYDYNGELREIADPLGGKYRLEYGEAGLRSVSAPGGWVAEMAYDSHGNLTSVRPGAKEGGIALGYDERGQISSVETDKGMLRLERDHSGKVVAITNAAGEKTVAGRDARSRITSITDPAGRTVAVERDDFDRVTALETEGGRFEYEYDDRGRLTGVAMVSTTTTHFVSRLAEDDSLREPPSADGGDLRVEVTQLEYSGGRTTGVVYPDGGRVDYVYDDVGRLVEVGGPTGDRVVYEYDDSGRVVGIVTTP